MEVTLNLIKKLYESVSNKEPIHQIIAQLKQIESNILPINISHPTKNATPHISKEELQELKELFQHFSLEVRTSLHKMHLELQHLKGGVTKNDMFTEDDFFPPTNFISPKEKMSETPKEDDKKDEPVKESHPKPAEQPTPILKTEPTKKDTESKDKNQKFRSHAIDLNQKILYIQNLFQGNSEEFKNVINTILVSNDKHEAEKIIQERFPDKMKPGVQQDAFDSFQEWVLSKF